ncbi:tyrosine--tRNA ligase [Patescibacteria group bacterium]|nr:tyrosine--tRNA ligase [Patescibacteria group bacterium]
MDDIEQLLTRGVEEVIEKDHLEKRLRAGEKLRIKHGADPTAPDLHLGHAVVLRKLREFQNLGHNIVFIIGDFTAKIGDPSGRSAARPVLLEKEIKENAKTYFKQAGKILNIKKTEIHYNSEWFNPLTGGRGWQEVLETAGKFTIQRILERDDFDKRIKSGIEITIKEILYPLMQAYDSVEVKADVEIGGTDQKFNMLAGRALQRRTGQNEQDVITTPILIGLDGEQKMSKSLGNYIGLIDSPDEMFGKTMSIPDKIINNWAELATNIFQEIKAIKNPRDAKMRLAYEIVKIYHGEKEAEKTQENFIKLFQKKEIPKDIQEIKIKEKKELGDILIKNKIVSSKSEFRRLIKDGAIDLDTKTIKNVHHIIDKNAVAKIGKKKFIKIVFYSS